jgi:hypothetical protein
LKAGPAAGKFEFRTAERNNGMPAEADIPLRYRATTSRYLRMTTISRTR